MTDVEISFLNDQDDVVTQTHQIEDKPFTLLVPAASILEVNVPNTYPINSETTIYHIDRVKNFDLRFWYYWEMLFKGANSSVPIKSIPAIPDVIRKSGDCYKHLAGVIDLILKLAPRVQRLYIDKPETFCHPSMHGAITQVIIQLQKDLSKDEQQRC